MVAAPEALMAVEEVAAMTPPAAAVTPTIVESIMRVVQVKRWNEPLMRMLLMAAL